MSEAACSPSMGGEKQLIRCWPWFLWYRCILAIDCVEASKFAWALTYDFLDLLTLFRRKLFNVLESGGIVGGCVSQHCRAQKEN